MDLTTITHALGELYERARHLPRPRDLAQTVLAAYHNPTHAADSPRRLAGVVAVLWPIGATAGAARGYSVTVAAIRDVVAQVLADSVPDPRGRWVVMGFARAADDLPLDPDPGRRYRLVDAGALVGDPRRLDRALTVGLVNSWLAGHRDGTERALDLFAAGVIDLIGPQWLATTFVHPTLPADTLLEEVGYAAYWAADRDREEPRSPPARSGPPPGRPSAARAFMALRRVDPTQRNPTSRLGPSTGPGRRGPGR